LQRSRREGNDGKEIPMKKTTAQILGGLAVGAAGALAMYLLDPVSGKRRRERIREQAERAERKTRETIEGGARSVRLRAEELAARLQPQEGDERAVDTVS
jgi:gas vesicle protein